MNNDTVGHGQTINGAEIRGFQVQHRANGGFSNKIKGGIKHKRSVLLKRADRDGKIGLRVTPTRYIRSFGRGRLLLLENL